MALFLSLFTLFLNACNQTETAEEATVIPATPVSVWSPSNSPTYLLKEVGTVKALQEVEVVAKAGGIVDKLNVEVGDSVNADQALGKIDLSANSNTLINLSNANNQLANAQRGYDEGLANNQNLVNQTKLRAENLETTLARLERNLRELEKGNTSTENSLDLQVSTAEQNVENTQINLVNLEKQFQQSVDDFFSRTEVTADSLLVNADSYYQTATNIINSSRKNRIHSDDFNYLLGASNSSQRNQTINLYNDFSSNIERKKEDIEELFPLNEDNFNEAMSHLKEVVEMGRELNAAMRVLLQNSNSSVNLPAPTLESYKSQVAAAETGSLQDLSTVNNLPSSYQELERQQNTQLATAQNNLTVAQNQLTDTQNSLNQFGTSGSGSIKDLENQIESTKNDLANAYLDYENTIRTAELQNNAKDLEIQTYQNQVSLAKDALNDANLTAPIGGTVSEVYVDVGDTVNPGTQVLKINQQDQLKVVFYVTEKQARWLSVGQDVSATLNDSEKTQLQGRLIQIAPTADAQNRKIKVEANFDESSLRPEMFVSLEVDVSEAVFKSSRLYVPLNAVVFDQTRQFVFVVEKNLPGGPLAQKRAIETGEVIDQWVEVTDGLDSEDHVIFEGSRGLEQGERVEVNS